MIQLSESEIAILGRPNFACAGIAKVLIDHGVYEKGAAKAEYEQAVYIHWASNLLKEHGENWKLHGNNIIRDLLEESISPADK